MPTINPYQLIDYASTYNLKKEDDNYIAEKGTLAYETFGTTDHSCVIIELESFRETRQRLEIQFVPQGISGSRTANLQEIAIVGRNDPLYHFTSGKETLTLPLEFYSDNERHDDVKRKIDWLRSLTINNGNIGGYRNVKIIFGDLFRFEVWVVKNVKYNYTHFDGQSKFLPLRATVVLSLALDTKQNLQISDFRL